jgi:putative membrane protein
MSEQRADVVDATRRTRLANERTFLAWLRTALTAVAVAIGAGKIVPGVTDVAHWPFEILGAGFAALAVLLVAYGALRFVRVEEALASGEFVPLRPAGALLIAAISGVLGLGTLAFIFVH